MVSRRRFLSGLAAGVVLGPVADARGAPAAPAGRRAGSGGAVSETTTVSYDDGEETFSFEFDYEIPDNVVELRIQVRSLSLSSVSVAETESVDRESQTEFRWDGGVDPRVVLDRSVSGETYTEGEAGYVADDAAFTPTVATRLSFRYRGSVPGRERSVTFSGEGAAGTGYVYAGPHEARTRTVDGVPLRVVLPGEVDDGVDAGPVLDLYEYGERNMAARVDYDRVDAFVIPSSRRGTWPVGVATNSSVVLDEEHATVDTIRNVPAHEYAHVLLGSFGSDEMYWLTEGSAEYYGYLLSLAHGVASFDDFLEEARADRHEDAVLVDTERMRTTTANYEKGAHVLAALDAEIRERSSDDATLLTALTADGYDLSAYDEFESAVVETADDEGLRDWLDQYVRSSDLPSIPDRRDRFTLGEEAASTPTPTPSPTPTPTPSPTPTPTPSPTPTPTPSPTQSPTASPTPVATETGTGTAGPTRTNAPRPTPAPTVSPDRESSAGSGGTVGVGPGFGALAAGVGTVLAGLLARRHDE